MRFGSIFGAAVLATGLVAPVQAAGCDQSASKLWPATEGRPLLTEAYSNGRTCAAAVVTIVVRGADGKVLWTDAMAAEFLMTFVEAKTPAKMKAALADWLFQSHTFKSTGDLPEWKKGAEAPTVVGEFPFYPEAGVDQEGYSQIRAEKQPIFCYVQGMESLSCIGLSKDGAMTKIGVQTFPG